MLDDRLAPLFQSSKKGVWPGCQSPDPTRVPTVYFFGKPTPELGFPASKRDELKEIIESGLVINGRLEVKIRARCDAPHMLWQKM